MQKRSATENSALVTIQLDAPLSEAIELMNVRAIRHLPVLDGSELVGVVSERDLTVIESLMRSELGTVRVAEAMTPEPYCVGETAQLSEVAKTMAMQKYGCVLITDEHGALTDIFTASDALALLAETVTGRTIGDALRGKARPSS